MALESTGKNMRPLSLQGCLSDQIEKLKISYTYDEVHTAELICRNQNLLDAKTKHSNLLTPQVQLNRPASQSQVSQDNGRPLSPSRNGW
jgi:hypothetical protein